VTKSVESPESPQRKGRRLGRQLDGSTPSDAWRTSPGGAHRAGSFGSRWARCGSSARHQRNGSAAAPQGHEALLTRDWVGGLIDERQRAALWIEFPDSHAARGLDVSWSNDARAAEAGGGRLAGFLAAYLVRVLRRRPVPLVHLVPLPPTPPREACPTDIGLYACELEHPGWARAHRAAAVDDHRLLPTTPRRRAHPGTRRPCPVARPASSTSATPCAWPSVLGVVSAAPMGSESRSSAVPPVADERPDQGNWPIRQDLDG